LNSQIFKLQELIVALRAQNQLLRNDLESHLLVAPGAPRKVLPDRNQINHRPVRVRVINLEELEEIDLVSSEAEEIWAPPRPRKTQLEKLAELEGSFNKWKKF
jgi:hypothetical protein